VAQSASAGVGDASARFSWIAGRLSGCPAALRIGPITARPCAGIDAGALRGRGSGVAQPLGVTRAWGAVTALGRLQGEIYPGMALEIEGGAAFPLTRDTFVFDDPRREIHAIPAVGGFGSAGLGVAFE
jgi:hypothetical protein